MLGDAIASKKIKKYFPNLENIPGQIFEKFSDPRINLALQAVGIRPGRKGGFGGKNLDFLDLMEVIQYFTFYNITLVVQN